MYSPQYEGFYGSIERVGKGSVQTLFYQFMLMPVFPQGTYWVTGNGLFGNDLKVLDLRRSMPSIVIGYLRGWLTTGAFWTICAGLFLAIVVQEPLFPQDPLFFGRTIMGVVLTLLGIGLACAAVLAWFLTRRPVSADELARRAVFQGTVGYTCDPAMLPNPWSERDDLKRKMASIAEAMGLGRSFDEWPALVQRFDVPLPAGYLRMAMTVARLERAVPADGTDVTALPRLEEGTWQRLCTMDPSARNARPI
jgi:hypothetical protein